MNAVTSFISEHTGWLVGSPEHRWQAMVLLMGLSLLAIALVVLMLTRWGQVRPLSKCIVLSVFAHILLMVYAYGLCLFHDAPGDPVDEVIQVTLLSPDDESFLDQPVPEESPVEPLEEPFEVESPTEESTEVEDPAEPPPTTSPITRQAEPTVSDTPLNDAAADDVAEPTPPAADAGPDVPLAAPPASDEVPSFTAPRPLVVSASAEPIEKADSARSPYEMPQTPDDLQHLADLPTATDPSEYAADRQDQLAPTIPQATPSEQTRWHAADQGERDEMPTTGVPSQVPAPPAPRLRSGDAAPLPALYAARMQQSRVELAAEHGGSQETENAVQAALDWLVANQGDDGRWDCDMYGGGQETRVLGQDRGGAGVEADTGISGLALLAFLGAGHTHLEGDYRETVRRGLEFLLASQASDGNMAGNARLYARMYCHGMATLALSEACALTGDHRITPHLQRAVAYSVAAQDRNGGGWRYQPGDPGDMSQMGWQLMALHSAEAAGLPLPAVTRTGMIRFLQQTTTGTHRGLAGYRPYAAATRTMTAEALVCRIFLRRTPHAAAQQEAVAFLLQETPQYGEINLYYWYYATLALFQLGGDAWTTWNEALTQRLLATQRRSGPATGSWDPTTVWGSYGGRVYSTAMAALCLEVYYRYLPIYTVNH
jgi:hypothetical protein